MYIVLRCRTYQEVWLGIILEDSFNGEVWMYTCNGGWRIHFVRFGRVDHRMLYSEESMKETYVQPKWGGSLTAQNGSNGSRWNGYRRRRHRRCMETGRGNARMETCLLRFMADNCSSNTMVQSIHRKINNDNHYSDYFIKYTHTSIDMRASCWRWDFDVGYVWTGRDVGQRQYLHSRV
jgi:hypothetical protein